MKSALLVLTLLVSLGAGANDRAATLPMRTAETGGVTVSVTPLTRGKGDPRRIDFQIVMDTHAGTLPLNMLRLARLIWEHGAETTPLSWSGSRGGHHLSGRLSFPTVSPETAETFTLVLSLDGKNDLRFEWKAPSSFARDSSGGA